jgi:hypothetical protein
MKGSPVRVRASALSLSPEPQRLPPPLTARTRRHQELPRLRPLPQPRLRQQHRLLAAPGPQLRRPSFRYRGYRPRWMGVEVRGAADNRPMSAEPSPAPESVELEDGRVRIHELVTEGALAELVQHAQAEGRELEAVVRQALEVGAAVLLHGAAKNTLDAVGAEVDRLLTAMNERSSKLEVVRQARTKIAARGFGFEEELGAVLDNCFVPHEDVFEATGATRGIAEEKTGDFVLTVNPRDTAGHHRRVVFEAKDRPLPLQKALSELDAAMLNRGAHVGVMVFARSGQAPLKGRPLRVFPGNRILVVWEQEEDGNLALDVAAQLARTLAIAAERDDGKLNRRGVGSRVEQLITVIESADRIRRSLAGARRGLDDADDAYEEMRDQAMTLLYELQDRL